MRAAVVVTGTEVLEGRVRDENGAMIGADLAAAGVSLTRTIVVGDGLDDIRDAVGLALSGGVDLVVVTGGLGPTHDDRTMEAVAHASGSRLVEDPAALALVRAALEQVPVRGPHAARERGARKQAQVPEGAVVLPPAGTAPGAVVDAGGPVVAVLPGPPWECRAAWEEARRVPAVSRVLDAAGGGAPRELRMAGVVESEFMQVVDESDPEGRGLVVGVCARPGELEVTLRPPGPEADAFTALLEARFPGAIFSRDGAGVEEVVGRLLAERGQALATAESCTGGMIGARLTAVAGASAWYRGGVVSYSDDAKHAVLDVPRSMLEEHGAVSGPVARQMARGARAALGAEWAVAVTGIAGPGGATAQKPVGLVYVCVTGPGHDEVRELRLHGDRERIRMRSATIALHLVRQALAA